MSENPAIPFALPFTHYASLGYHPIPIKPGQKIPAGGKNWNTKQYDYVKLDAGNYSVGLLCDNVAGFDIDALDPARANAIEDLCRKICRLPKNTVVRVGMAPKRLLIVRVDAPMKGCDAEGFQLLGAGKQFVLHGIHPDTHLPYTLSRALPATHALPLVTPGMISELQLALGVRKKMESTPAPESPRWDDRNMGLAADKLMQIDPDLSYPDWFKVACAIHAGTHGDAEGFEMFDMWSSTGKKYKHDAVVTLWRSIRPGKGVNTGTLFANDFPKIREPKTEKPKKKTAGGDSPFTGGHNANDLMKRPKKPTPWVIENVLTYGAHLLIGRPKGGKSWITQSMVVSGSNGTPFLGYYHVPQKCDVLWICIEDDDDGIIERLQENPVHFDSNVIIYTMENFNELQKEGSFADALEAWLAEHPSVKLVIMDTQSSVERAWRGEIRKAHGNVMDEAYESSRAYELVGRRCEACILLVRHSRKRNGKLITDLHETVDTAATVVAGATASLVLADHPDRAPNDPDDNRKVFATRGRRIRHDELHLIRLTENGEFTRDGSFFEVEQTAAQADMMNAIEGLWGDLHRSEGFAGHLTIGQIARTLGVHNNSVQQMLTRMKKDPAKMLWKSKKVEVINGVGVRLRDR